MIQQKETTTDTLPSTEKVMTKEEQLQMFIEMMEMELAESTRIEEQEQNKSKGKGRPRATHKRIRFTTIIDEDIRDKMKIIAIKEGSKTHDLFNRILGDFVTAYENEKGAIQ